MSKFSGWVKDNYENTRELIGSGVEGAQSAIKAARPEGGAAPAVGQAALSSWKSAAVGACVGVVAGMLSDDRKPGRGAIWGGFLGATIGLSVGMAWGAREVIGAAAGGAMKNVSNVRDTQWLAKHPINYA